MKLSRRILLVGLALALVLVAGAMWADASNGYDIHACYNPEGQLRIVDDVSDCRGRETELEWNKQGPQGPPGVLGFYTITNSPISAPANSFQSGFADCDSGDQVTGGGFGADPSLIVKASRPADQDTWHVRVYNPTVGPLDFAVDARCADMTP